MVDTPPNANSPSTVVTTQPTTASTTSVIVPTVQNPPVERSYLDWGNVVFILGGVVAFILLMGQLMNVIESVLGFFERRKKKDQEQDAPMEARIKNLEETAKTFRSKDDLDERFQAVNGRIDHERNNRLMTQDGFDTRLRTVTDNQSADRLVMTELKAKVETIATNSQRAEDAIESLRERVDERFDRLHDAILNKPLSRSRGTSG